MRKLFPFLGKYKKYIALGPLCVLLDVACEVSIPVLMASIIDEGIMKGNMQHIVKIGIIMVLLALFAAATGGSNSYFSSKAAQGLGANLRDSLFSKIQSFSFADVDRFSTSSLVTRCTSDVNSLQMAVMMSLRLLVRSPLMLVSALVMSLRINSELTMILLVAIPVLLISIGIILKTVNPLFHISQKKVDVLNRTVQENVIGQRVVKAFVRKNQEEGKFKIANDDVMQITIRALSVMMWATPIMMIVMNGAVVAALWFGGQQVSIGGFGIGELNSFINYAMQILISFIMMAMMLVMVARSKASYDRIFEVLEVTPDIQNPMRNALHSVASGEVRFDHVSFSYQKDAADNVILSDIDFSVQPGQIMAIVGSTGSGKSTLVNLIPRLYDVSEGAVLVGEHDVREYDQAALRDAIGVVLQNNVLFSGSIRENIKWGKEDATEEEIVAACKAAQAHDFIMSFPEGYDTHIEQGGTNVSGGQRQRLCIARALVKKPRILILDDSTSAVDTATESKIREAFYQEMKGTTVFLVAQRISSVQDADSIIVMDNGTISGVGTHEQLLENNAIYQEIYRSQSGEVA